jgi:hypothetical protein
MTINLFLQFCNSPTFDDFEDLDIYIDNDNDNLIPDSIPVYEIQNPTILTERKNNLFILSNKFPILSETVLQAVLEECQWDLKLAILESVQLDSQASQEALSKPLQEENHPSVQLLAAKYPQLEWAVIVLALRKSAYDPDVAELYFQDDGLLFALRTESNGSNSTVAENKIANFKEAFLHRQIREEVSVPAPAKRVVTVDMHGMTRESAPECVWKTLAELKPGAEKVNFITGRGRHSKNEVPLLRPLVLKILEEKGIECSVMPANPGIVQAFVGKRGEEGGKMLGGIRIDGSLEKGCVNKQLMNIS